MASHRQCFYCKNSFQSSQFHNHLKQCPQRQKKPNPPLQQNPPPSGQYGQYQRPPMNNNNALWTCNMCSFQNSPNAQVCTMCQQGKKMMNQPPPQQPMQMRPPYGGGFGQPQQQPPRMQYNQPPPQQPQQQQNKQDAYWECQSCTFVNSKMSASCKICSNPQPKGNNNPSPPQQQPPPPQQHNMFGQPPPQLPNNNGPPPQFQQNNMNNMNNNNNNNNNNNMNHGGMPPPPPPMQEQKVNNMNNNNNNNNNMNMNMQQNMGGGGRGPQEPDEATRLLIEQLMAASRCVTCGADNGLEMTCGHCVCGKCAKKYILNGIATMRWKKEQLSCPKNDSGQKCDGVIAQWIWKECGLGIGMQKKLEEMQNKYMISADPSMTSCPKCGETYCTEQGDISGINTSEKGPDGKQLSRDHLVHKAKYRFRCSSNGCKTIFCSGCQTTPYHIGYTCIEYKNYRESKKCRFCEVSLTVNNTAPKDFTLKSGLDNVCSSAECLEKRRWSCDLKHNQCGHNCIGLMGHECIPCLNPKCLPKNADVTDDEYCNICWVDPLRAAPCVFLKCGHYFHFMCLWQKIDRKWPAARITFGFLNCPLCKKEIHHAALDDITKKYYDLKAEIQKDAVERVKIEGLQNDKRLTDESSPYYNNLSKFAMDRLAFYPCSKCKKPYFGGMKACEEAGLEQAENYKQEHLVCGSCASGPNAKSCKKHGKKYITYKCKFCCSVSSWYCWGSTHFCDKCHKKQEQGDYLNRKPISELPKCPGKDKCPLGIQHPANGTAEFSLGCVVCLRK